ncbi:MAG: anthranilate synthase component I family protein [Steroidobacteraceae bacterium]
MRRSFDIAGDLETPVSAFLKLAAFDPIFLLESVEGAERVGRYSFIGLGKELDVRLENGELRCGAESLPVPDCASLLAGLRRALAAVPHPRAPRICAPLAGGLVGYSNYDVIRRLEPAMNPANAPGIELHYSAPRTLLVFDHLTRGINVLHSGSEAERQSLCRELTGALAAARPKPRPGRGASEPSQSLSREDFCERLASVRGHIASGDVYQLVLSVQFQGRHSCDPFEVYRALRLINPSPYMYFCRFDEQTVVGSSPEALVRLQQGLAQLRPIAGTRPRGAHPAEDEANAKELLADAKENAEHVMLVDLARNDLGRVAHSGSVIVDPFRSIERYSHVMHMVSGVAGRLADGRDAFDLFAAAFPAGTLVGAPKVRAMQIIDELEPVRRGLYGGTVGYFGADGNMDQAIAIRTLVFRGDEYTYQAGAGIVADSNDEGEWQEVLAKSASAARALALGAEGL